MSVAVLTDIEAIAAQANEPSPVSGGGAKGLTSSSWLLVSASAEAILPFLRNIVLARLLVPQEFGIAITFAVVISMVEVLTDFGLPVYAVRKSGAFARARTMGTVQSLALVRAASIGAFLAAASPFVAQVFHASHSAWAYTLLGLIAFLRGFENFGVKEAMRHFVFWREATVIICSQISGIVVAICVAYVMRDFTCLVWGMLATTVTMVIGSHLLSPHPYRVCWEPAAARDASAFGRPLLLNGAAVSFGLSDRMIVGSFIGSTALAVYNVAYGTATLPRSVLTKFLTSAFLPLFVEHHESQSNDGRLFGSWAVFLSGLSFVYAIMMCWIGDSVLGLVFGAAYKPSRLFMCLAGMSVCVKFLMLLPVPAAYASGQTRIITTGSFMSAASVLPAAACLIFARNLDLFLLGIATAEAVALVIFADRFMRKLAFPTALVWRAIATPYALLTGIAVTAAWLPQLDMWAWACVCGGAGSISILFYGRQFKQTIATLRPSKSSSHPREERLQHGNRPHLDD